MLDTYANFLEDTTAEATKTAEQLMAEKVAEVVGADFKFRKL